MLSNSRVYHLSIAALPSDESDWGSSVQVLAQNAFFLECERLVPEVFAPGSAFEEYANKASGAELIREGLARLAAHSFLFGMRDDFDVWTLAEMDRRNAAETDRGVCHSHDFCDANMVMHSAFLALGFETPADDCLSETDREWLCTVWNRAWDIAKETGFAPKV